MRSASLIWASIGFLRGEASLTAPNPITAHHARDPATDTATTTTTSSILMFSLRRADQRRCLRAGSMVSFDRVPCLQPGAGDGLKHMAVRDQDQPIRASHFQGWGA